MLNKRRFNTLREQFDAVNSVCILLDVCMATLMFPAEERTNITGIECIGGQGTQDAN
jgi:hypothetical protein